MEKHEIKILSSYAEKIVEKKLSVPAIFFLESTKYISFIGSQALVFLGPLLTLFVNDAKYYQYVEILEKKENIEYLITMIEKNNFAVKK